MIKCIGCGATIQFDNPKREGYLDKNVYEKRGDENVLCNRCFRIRNYNENEASPIPEEVYLKIIDHISYSKNLFVYVADIFDITTLNVNILNKFKNRDLIIVFNRYDLIPKSAKEGKIKAKLKDYLKKYDIKYKDLICTSAMKNYNIDKLGDLLFKWSKGRHCYLIGQSNVGKSSLLNALIKDCELSDQNIITTSNMIGTTLSLIEIPFFDKNKKLYDTPGLVTKNNLLSLIDHKDFKYFQPRKELKPKTYQMKKGNSLIIGGICLVTCLDDINLSLYFNNEIEILKTKNPDNLFPERSQELFKIKTEIKELDTYEFSDLKNNDIILSGFGFINVKSDGKIIVKIIKNCHVEIRNELLG